MCTRKKSGRFQTNQGYRNIVNRIDTELNLCNNTIFWLYNDKLIQNYSGDRSRWLKVESTTEKSHYVNSLHPGGTRELGHHCSGNGLAPGRLQALAWTNAKIVSTKPSRIYPIEM